MKSKTSFFNTALLKKNILRFSPIWIAYLALWTVIQPMMLFMSLSSPWKMERLEVAENICGMMAGAGPAVSCVYGLVLAMAMFAYLHSARSVAMMHSLPIRRSGLYLTNYISGLACIVVPNAVIAVLTALVTLIHGVFCPGMTLGWFLGMCAMGLFFYSFAVFLTMFTGNLVAVPIFYAIFNCLCFVLYWTLNFFIEPFLYGMRGYTGLFDTLIKWLTPLLCMYQEVSPSNSYQVNGEGFEELARVDLNGTEVLVLYAAAGVVLAVLAYLVYRRRRSEAAGDVVTVGWAKVLFRYGVGLTAALTIGQGVYYLLFQSSALDSAAVELIVMILAAAVGFLVAQMLLHKSFRVVKKSVRGSAICAVVILAVFVMATLDVTGVTRRIPDVDQVAEVHVNISGNGYSNAALRDAEGIEKTVALHRYAVEHRRELESFYRQAGYYSHYDSLSEDEVYLHFSITYELKNGTMMYRQYTIPVRAEEAGDAETSAGLVRALVDMPAYRAANAIGDLYKLRDENGLQIIAAQFYYYEEGDVEIQQTYRLRESELDVIYAALLEDAAAGRMPKVRCYMDYDTADRENDGMEYVNDMEIDYRVVGEDGTYADYSSNAYFSLSKDMTSTIAALEDLGILNDRVQLRTRGEQDALEREKYADEYGDKYDAENDVPSASVEVAPPVDTENVVM